MTYNSYYPAGGYQYQNPYYLQYQPQMPVMQTPNIQQQSQSNQQIQAATSNPASIIWVANEKEAAMFPVTSNTAVALWDSSSPVIYLKQADASGKPTMRTYDLVERIDHTQETSNSSSADVSHFANKSDVVALAGVVNTLSKDIEAIKEEMGNLASQAVKRAVGAKSKVAKEPTTEDDE